MYWPIGAPRIYAASNNKVEPERTFELDDDAESRETTEGSGSLVDAGSVESEEKPEDSLEPPQTPLSPTTPGIKPVEHDSQNDLSTRHTDYGNSSFRSAESEPLLALRISRTGHLFAVITSTSLTVWQTKVCHSNAWLST